MEPQATSDAGQHSPLLDIPPELRLKIYDHALDSSSLTFEVHPNSAFSLDKNWRAPFWVHPPSTYAALVRSCRLIQHEVSPYLDEITSWHLRGDRAIEHFVYFMSKAQKNKLTQLTGVNTTNYQYMRYLNNFPKLNIVQVQFRPSFIGQSTPAQFGALSFDVIVDAVLRAGLDYLGPKAIEYHIEQGRWEKFTVDAGIYFDYNSETANADGFLTNYGRFIVVSSDVSDILIKVLTEKTKPCTLDLVNRTVVKHTERIADMSKMQRALGDGKLWAAHPHAAVSTIAEAEHERFKEDASPLQIRYAKYFGTDPTKVESMKLRRSKRQRHD